MQIYVKFFILFLRNFSYLCRVKRILKYSLVYALLIAFFASTTGVFYVVHHCSSEHKDYIFFASATADCEHHHHKNHVGTPNAQVCTCDFPLSHEQFNNESCCVNHYHLAKLESDFMFSSQNAPTFSIPVLYILFANIDCVSSYKILSSWQFVDFFPPLGVYDKNTFLSSICQFLI